MTDFVDGPTRSQTVSLKTNKAIFSQEHKTKKNWTRWDAITQRHDSRSGLFGRFREYSKVTRQRNLSFWHAPGYEWDSLLTFLRLESSMAPGQEFSIHCRSFGCCGILLTLFLTMDYFLITYSAFWRKFQLICSKKAHFLQVWSYQLQFIIRTEKLFLIWFILFHLYHSL